MTQLPEGCASRIEGIGRPRVEPSFVPSVIDRMIAVEDAGSIGAMRALSDALGRRVGGSTGTNVWACARIAQEMAAAGAPGSIVTLLCDGGDRYSHTYYNDAWLAERGVEWRAEADRVASFLGSSGALVDPKPSAKPAPLVARMRQQRGRFLQVH